MFLVYCSDSMVKRLCSDGLKIPKSDSLYTQGTWELKSMLVLSTAQPFERGPPIYNRVREVPFDIPQGYVKGHSIYRRYMEEPCESQNVMLTNNNNSYT